MNDVQNLDFSLRDIVKHMSKDSYYIPEFQRDFVWKSKDISDLGDSIMRGYPISSFLIIGRNGSLNVGSHSLLKNNARDNINENEKKYYILDGQQRLTSISKLFLGFDDKNEYYFDLLALLIEQFPDDNIQDDAGITEKCVPPKRMDTVCRSFKIAKGRSEQATRTFNRFISGKKILDNEFGAVIRKFMDVLRDVSEDMLDKYTNYLNAILGGVGGYSIPVTIIDSDSELSLVIRVFEKVNSTGIKLTLYDLINAKSFQIESTDENRNKGLTYYLTSQLNQNSRKGINKFFKNNNKTYEKLDRIIHILELSHLLKKELQPNMSKSSMLKKEPEFWFDAWASDGEKILEIISWMDKEGLVDIGQFPFLEYAIAIFLASPNSFKSERFKNEIKKYALSLAVKGIQFSKTYLGTIVSMYNWSKQTDIDNRGREQNFNVELIDINLKDKQILEITTLSNKFKAIINILYIQKVKGLFKVDICGDNLMDINKEKMNNHYILPKSLGSQDDTKGILNSIANVVLIRSKSNSEKMKDDIPKKYFSEIIEIESNSKQNLIEINDATIVNDAQGAELFLEKRAAKIAEIVNEYFLPVVEI